MADTFGLSFSPFGTNNNRQQNGQPSGGGPVQDAIRVLSLKIPRVTGGSPIPSPLLNAPGAMANPIGTAQSPAFQGDLLAVIRRMLGLSPMEPMGQASGSIGAMGTAAPSSAVPRFIPGIGAGGGIGTGEPAPGSGTPGPINPGNQVSTAPGGVNWADILNRGGITGDITGGLSATRNALQQQG